MLLKKWGCIAKLLQQEEIGFAGGNLARRRAGVAVLPTARRIHTRFCASCSPKKSFTKRSNAILF